MTTEEGESLKCDMDAWGMTKKKARNALANKMLRIRRMDPMMIDEDSNATLRGFSGGTDDRQSKRTQMLPKEELNNDQAGGEPQPRLRGYLAQLEDALDDGETEEGEIQE